MASILTNIAALSALQTLRNINTQLDMTQSRISTGLKVATAVDNASYWSIATTMRSDSNMMSSISDALGLGAAQTDTAYQGMNSAIDLVSQIKSKLLTAKNPGVDKVKINTEISALKSQLATGASASSFNSQNWLYNTSTTASGTKEIVGSFNRDASGNLSIGVVSVNTANTVLVDTSDANRGLLTKSLAVSDGQGGTAVFFLMDAHSTTAAAAIGGTAATEAKLTSTTTDAEITGMINAVDKVLSSMTDAASVLGATTSTVSKQGDFIKTLKASVDRGIGSLVDADMNEESSKLKALQTQQQLGIQALTIANSNSSNVLSLFR